MKITITHNGFHGFKTVSFFDGKPMVCGDPDDNMYQAQVSARVGKKLNNLVCGCADCSCGEQVTSEICDRDGDDLALIVYRSEDGGKTGEICGNYPQNA